MKIQRSSLDVSVQMGRWWRIRRSFGSAVLSILLVVVVAQQVQHSSAVSTWESQGKQQLMRWNHPKRELVDQVNKNGGPYVGIVMAYSTEEIALQSSGLFVPNSQFPTVDLSGRRFNIGSIRGTNVIYVMSGQRRLNAGITVQILLDVFDILGIVHYGIAGSANNSLSFGDVSVPKYVAFTGSWRWMNFESEEEKGEFTEMKFGDYNFPKEGENLLAKVEFKTEELYSVGQPMKEVFWLEVDQTWFKLAAQLQDLELQQCVNETYCLPKIPRVEYGLRGSTADIFVDNAAYRKFLIQKFQVSTIDEESAAVVMTAMSSGVGCIVFRGVSDLAGGGGGGEKENDKLKLSSSSSMFLGSLASINVLNVTVKFIELIGKQKTYQSD